MANIYEQYVRPETNIYARYLQQGEPPPGYGGASVDNSGQDQYASVFSPEAKKRAKEQVARYQAGAFMGLRDVIDAAAQMASKATGIGVEGVDQSIAAANEAYKSKGGGTAEANAGRIVGNVAAMAPLMAAPGMAATGFVPRLAASTVTGGAVGALQPTENTPEFWKDKALQTGIGAALGGAGQAAVTGAAKVLSPVLNRLNPEQARLAGVFEREVGKLTPGQATGSKPVTMLESVLANTPGSSGAQSAVYQKQRDDFTRAVLKKAGIDADKAGPDVLAKATDSIGKEFDRLSAGTSVNLDRQFFADLLKTATQYHGKLPTNQRPVFDSYLGDLLNKPKVLDGSAYQTFRSDLTRHYRSVRQSDPNLSNALKDLRNALDDANERSITPALRNAWDDTRRRYGNLKDITKAMEGSQSVSGDISPVALFNAAAQGQGRNRFARGAGELNDLSRAGVQFLRQPPDSGTAQRAMLSGLIQGGIGVGAGGYASGGDMGSMAAGFGAGIAAPAAVQRFMGSRMGQAYLRNNAANPGLFSPWLIPAEAGLLNIAR